MITVKFSYDDLVFKLKTGEKFSFSRVGDGEANCIYRDRKRTMNSDLHTYFEDLGDALMGVLKSAPDYYLGLQGLAYRQRKDEIDRITKKYGIKWCGSDILHNASINRQLDKLFEALENRKVMVVGPAHLKSLPFYDYFVEVPAKDAWLSYESIHAEINTLLKSLPDAENMVVIYCCGMMSCVLIDNFAGQCTQIDAGSVFDPYCGINSRRYHFNIPEGKNNKPSEYFVNHNPVK